MGSVLPCCQQSSDSSPASNPTPAPQPRTKSRKVPPQPKTDFAPTTDGSKGEKEKQSAPAPFPMNSKYTTKKLLGKGQLGTIVLVQHFETEVKYAMKLIPKGKIKEHNLLESNILGSIRNNPFLVSIVEIREYGDNIYIVMEYLSKGDLDFYIHKEAIQLPDSHLKAVLAQIIVGLQYLHQQGVVYRSLKPENILITDEGHVKLTDYSLSKMMGKEHSKGISTFKGSIQYMAPEIMKGPFDEKVDIWALGIVAYQLKFRENPVENSGKVLYNFNQYEELLKNNFIEQKINSKIGHMSHQFRQLLKKLLEQDPQNRISLAELLQHPFFQQIDWQQIKERRNSPPLSDMVKSNDNIRYRQPTGETPRRQSVTKRHGTASADFQFNLVQIQSQ